MNRLKFPTDFTWGAATSSYQIEGAHTAGGRGPSIWDTFCRTPGKVVRGENGDIACDHYHRYAQDVAMMAELGLEAYRFSVAWPRIFPTGLEATPNTAGLDFYDRLVDALLAAGITPWATLYHWDLPQPLQDRGGWVDRSIVDPWLHYVQAVARRLGDRVRHFITHNEPWVVCHLGHAIGEHAPGHKSFSEALAASHHVLLTHGLAVPVIRREAPGCQVGITLNLTPGVPASPSAADADATRWFDGYFNRWYLDPLAGRGYPADMVSDYQSAGHLPDGPLPWLSEGDLTAIATPTDFLGINFYSRAILRSDSVPEAENAPRTLPEPPPERCTDMGWEVWAPSLTDLLVRLRDDYGDQPLIITENGCAYATGPDIEGQVPDVQRIAYLQQHLAACHEALAQGVPLVGYFAWSLMDNFEWAFGYEKRFGLVWVDFDTQDRTPKASAHWYAEVIRAGGPPGE